MSDPTEPARRQPLQHMHVAGPASREQLESAYRCVWDTSELTQDFEVLGFLAPLVVVRRKSDGRKGCLTFQHNPRLYYDFVEERRKGSGA